MLVVATLQDPMYSSRLLDYFMALAEHLSFSHECRACCKQ